jgi:biotin carboxyl carrier protein
MPDRNRLYKIKVNGFVFSIDKSKSDAANLIQTSPTEFNVIQDHRSVNASLLEVDVTGKKMNIEVAGEVYEVEIKDGLDQRLEIMGFGVANSKKIKEIKAPMPGMVLEVVVSNGQEVNEGDRIVILGAMKMENSILVQANAKIKRVAVSVGQAVEKGQVLVELE